MGDQLILKAQSDCYYHSHMENLQFGFITKLELVSHCKNAGTGHCHEQFCGRSETSSINFGALMSLRAVRREVVDWEKGFTFLVSCSDISLATEQP